VAAVASFLSAVLTEIDLCDVCSCQEILRRNGRGQEARGRAWHDTAQRMLADVPLWKVCQMGRYSMAQVCVCVCVCVCVRVVGGGCARPVSLASTATRRRWASGVRQQS
jgi:hypothetical protein